MMLRKTGIAPIHEDSLASSNSAGVPLTYLEVLGNVPNTVRYLECRPLIPKELAAASSRPIVMSILSQGDDYGYSIIQRVREASGGEIEWSEGMLYPVLHRLEGEGLISASWKQTENGRRRKYYRLNAAGRRSLSAHRKQWASVHNTLMQLWGPEPCST